jgi:predicted DNA-binding protein
MTPSKNIPAGAMLLNDEQLSVRLPAIMVERLREIAAEESRSVNNVVRLALRDWINARV